MFYLALCLFFWAIVFGAGCSLTVGVPQWSGSGFLRKEFLEYKKVAILPFEGDSTGKVADTFTLSFQENFPQMAVIKREELLQLFRAEDLYPGQLDQAARAKIGKAFDVQALILGNVYYPSILRWLMQVKIIHTETGEVIGRSFIEIDYMGAEGIKQACRLAVQELKTK